MGKYKDINTSQEYDNIPEVGIDSVTGIWKNFKKNE